MEKNTAVGGDAVSSTVSMVRRRGLLKFGSLLTAITGSSVISAVNASGAKAVPGNAALNSYILAAEKATASGIATLDANAKIPVAQLPDLSVAIRTAVQNVGGAAISAFNVGNAGALTRPVLGNTPTYEGSGVAIHPSVLFFPEGWNGYRYWMGMTPYPSADSSKENPSILVSNDGNSWTVPAGLTNPIVSWNGIPGQYNSDPFLHMEGETMYCFWRAVEGSNMERFYFKTSTDGIKWSAAVLCQENLNSVARPQSQSINKMPDGTYVIHAVDTVRTRRMVRYTGPTISGPWTSTDCIIAGIGELPWHQETHYYDGRFFSLIQTGSNLGGDLLAAESSDGVTWSISSPLFTRHPGAWDAAFYKSAFVPANIGGVAGWDMWVSSANFPGTGPQIGRSFVSFAPGNSPQPLVEAEKLAEKEAREVLAARMGLYPWLAGDSFSRADSSDVAIAETGQTWEKQAGAFAISSKAAVVPTQGNTVAVVDVGTSEHWVTVRLDSTTDLTNNWLLARATDANNCYRFGFADAFTKVKLQKIVAGNAVGLGSYPFPVALRLAGVRLGIRCQGNVLTLYVNDVAIATVTDATLTGTKAGVQAITVGSKFRNFRVRASA